LEESFIGSFRLEQPRSFDLPAYSYNPTSEPAHQWHKVVEWQDLDAQNHVNNAVYLSFARQAIADMLSKQGESDGLAPTPSFFQMQDSQPALWGDLLMVSIHEETNPDGRPYFIAKITRQESGETIADGVLVY